MSPSIASPTCPVCGQRHAPDTRFCPVTGARLPASPAAPVRTAVPLAAWVVLALIGLVSLGTGGWLLVTDDAGPLPLPALGPTAILAVALDSQAAAPTLPAPMAPATDTSRPPASPTPAPTKSTVPTATVPPMPAASATPAGLVGHVAFVSFRDQDEEIYSISVDGSQETRLTHSPGADTEPALSPDGQQIAFVSMRAGGHRVFVMNVDGSDPHPLTDGRSTEEYSPCFSPDGDWIVFTSSRGGRFELWLIHPNGSGLTQLTTGPNSKSFAAWSPDGLWIAYNSLVNGQEVIKVIRPDGQDARVVLTREDATVSGWLGDRILFYARTGTGNDIFALDPDTGSITQLTHDPGQDNAAVGTNDGRFLIFNTTREGADEIYVMAADGTGTRPLTQNHANDYMASWGP